MCALAIFMKGGEQHISVTQRASAMAAMTIGSVSSTALPSLCFRPLETHSCIIYFKPIFRSKFNHFTCLFTRSIFSVTAPIVPIRRYGSSVVSCLVLGDSGKNHESESGESIRIQLPRRRLLVEFTCNDCGERTKRLINRLAYERGLVFVQCAGCLQHHKLVDNLGLIVEYDLRDETNPSSTVDQV